MGLLSDLLLLPITGPVRGLRFIAEQIRDQVEAERLSSIRDIEEELMSLALSHDRGELTDEAFTEQESALIERLDRVHAEREVWRETPETEDETEDEIEETAGEFNISEYGEEAGPA